MSNITNSILSNKAEFFFPPLEKSIDWYFLNFSGKEGTGLTKEPRGLLRRKKLGTQSIIPKILNY